MYSCWSVRPAWLKIRNEIPCPHPPIQLTSSTAWFHQADTRSIDKTVAPSKWVSRRTEVRFLAIILHSSCTAYPKKFLTHYNKNSHELFNTSVHPSVAYKHCVQHFGVIWRCIRHKLTQAQLQVTSLSIALLHIRDGNSCTWSIQFSGF